MTHRTDPQLTSHPARGPKANGSNWHAWSCQRIVNSLVKACSSQDVAKKAKTLPGIPPAEVDRWNCLAKIQRRYLDLLRERQLWDRQSARQYAIDHHECRADRKIVLVATADLTKTLRLMLNQVIDAASATGSAEPSHIVTAAVFAPNSWEDRFDADGCLVPTAWKTAEIPIAHERIEFATDFVDQARHAVWRLAQENGNFSSSELSFGCADHRVVGPLQRALAKYDIHGRWGVGRSVTESGPYRVLSALGELVSMPTADAAARCLRHPDIESWLFASGVKGDWLGQLDEYRMEFAPSRLPGKNGAWLGPNNKYRGLKAAWAKLDSLCRKLNGERRALSEWTDQFVQVLAEVYRHREWDMNSPNDKLFVGAAGIFRELFKEQLALPTDILPQVTADEAVELALEFVKSETIPPSADPNAIEILGWLELPLDDAEFLIVTGLNEGIVPRSTSADPFLPNALRQHLGIEDNDHRYAREAYALASIVQSRRQFHLIAGKLDVEGDPLIPSRLLFTGDDQAITNRWRNVLKLGESPVKDPDRGKDPKSPSHERSFGFRYLKPQKFVNRPLAPMSITSFATYLDCPYRYYLKRILKLGETTKDDTPELRPLTLGNIVHAVMEAFGNSDAKDSSDERVIEEKLHTITSEPHGSRVSQPITPDRRNPATANAAPIDLLRTATGRMGTRRLEDHRHRDFPVIM